MVPEIETTAIARETRGSDLSWMMTMVSLLSSPEVNKSVFTTYVLFFRRQMQELQYDEVILDSVGPKSSNGGLIKGGTEAQTHWEKVI